MGLQVLAHIGADSPQNSHTEAAMNMRAKALKTGKRARERAMMICRTAGILPKSLAPPPPPTHTHTSPPHPPIHTHTHTHTHACTPHSAALIPSINRALILSNAHETKQKAHTDTAYTNTRTLAGAGMRPLGALLQDAHLMSFDEHPAELFHCGWSDLVFERKTVRGCARTHESCDKDPHKHTPTHPHTLTPTHSPTHTQPYHSEGAQQPDQAPGDGQRRQREQRHGDCGVYV